VAAIRRKSFLPGIAYYVSGHGYGHAVRSCQVMRRLRERWPELNIHIRTNAPRVLFERLQPPLSYSYREIDVGARQKNSLEIEIGETLAAWRSLREKTDQLIAEEAAFLKRHDAGLIVSDISPLAFEIAAAVSLPSVAICNFTWDWIYRPFAAVDPGFGPLIERIASSYAKATRALMTAPVCHSPPFAEATEIPIIARVSPLTKIDARRRFGLPESGRVVLLSFGGFGLAAFPWQKLYDLEDYFFVTTGGAEGKRRNLLVLPENPPDYESLVRAADVIVGKLGYGLLADVVGHRIPLLCAPRADFAEHPCLVQALRDWATSEEIPQERLLAGDLAPYLERLLAKEERWAAIPLNGAEIAADEILRFVED
jgi:hypothetical protein